MKKLLFILLISPTLCFGQLPDVGRLHWVEGELMHQSVIDLPGMNSNQIFTAAKKYLISAFKNYNEVVASDDESLGQIAGSGITSSSYKGFVSDVWDIRFKFNYEVKDEKIRITFSNFESLQSIPSVPLQGLTNNVMTKKPVNKLTGPQFQIFDNLGGKFDSMNEEFLKSLEKKEDW